jgi:cytochrome c553
LLLVGVLGADLQPGWAQTPEERLPSCLTCHGEHGTSTNSEVPSLGGQKAPYMEIQLYLYRERVNRNDAMNAAIAGRENVPRIAGQKVDYLLKALREYKDISRPGYDASMGEVLQPVTDEELRDLAYFAARQP